MSKGKRKRRRSAEARTGDCSSSAPACSDTTDDQSVAGVGGQEGADREGARKRAATILAALVAVAALAAYIQTVGHEFTLDDVDELAF